MYSASACTRRRRVFGISWSVPNESHDIGAFSLSSSTNRNAGFSRLNRSTSSLETPYVRCIHWVLCNTMRTGRVYAKCNTIAWTVDLVLFLVVFTTIFCRGKKKGMVEKIKICKSFAATPRSAQLLRRTPLRTSSGIHCAVPECGPSSKRSVKQIGCFRACKGKGSKGMKTCFSTSTRKQSSAATHVVANGLEYWSGHSKCAAFLFPTRIAHLVHPPAVHDCAPSSRVLCDTH